MPDLKTFALRHKEIAKQSGASTAVKNATLEAANWLHSKTYGQKHRLDEDAIWDSDWDICLVADACRWDLFEEVQGEYDWLPSGPSGWSLGSASPEWYARTFAPERMPDDDVGVVTANPFAIKPPNRVDVLANTPLHHNPDVKHVDYVFNESWGCEVRNGYLDVTHPSIVSQRVWDALQNWTVDRLVVHYMQPHLPFRSRPEWFGIRHELDEFGERGGGVHVGEQGEPYMKGGKEIWKELRDGEREIAEVWPAYADNLRWVLDDINRLRRAADGTFLLTSDHGNGLGERGIWSHPPNIQIPALRRVPWVSFEGLGTGEFETRDIVDYETGRRPIDQQLRALGYK